MRDGLEVMSIVGSAAPQRGACPGCCSQGHTTVFPRWVCPQGKLQNAGGTSSARVVSSFREKVGRGLQGLSQVTWAFSSVPQRTFPFENRAPGGPIWLLCNGRRRSSSHRMGQTPCAYPPVSVCYPCNCCQVLFNRHAKPKPTPPYRRRNFSKLAEQIGGPMFQQNSFAVT